MNINKVINHMLMPLFLLASFNVYAESMRAEPVPYVIDEVFNLKILLSKDGTGIVKDIHCPNCDAHYLKITKNSRAEKNGVEVDIQEVKKRAGKSVGISFNPQIREVQYFRWVE